jgi:hypothetical protein
MELMGKGLTPGLVIPQPKIVFIALLHRKIVIVTSGKDNVNS